MNTYCLLCENYGYGCEGIRKSETVEQPSCYDCDVEVTCPPSS